MGKFLRKYKISQFHLSLNDIMNQFLPKDIYSITCSCGVIFVGETIRYVKIRLSEHERYLRFCLVAKSAGTFVKAKYAHYILKRNL